MLRRNFKVSKIDLARWSIDLVLPLRLFVYIGPYPKEREEGKRYERRKKKIPLAACANTVVPVPLSLVSQT